MYFLGSIFILLLVLFVLIIGLALPILAAVLVYRDAKRRVDCSPWLWALVAGFAPCFVGVIVYLIVKKDYPLKTDYPPFSGQEQEYAASYSSAEGDASEEQQGWDSAAYSNMPPQKKGLPTWAKALIIIGVVIVAILIIAAVISLVKYLFMGMAAYGSYDSFGGFDHLDDFYYDGF